MVNPLLRWPRPATSGATVEGNGRVERADRELRKPGRGGRAAEQVLRCHQPVQRRKAREKLLVSAKPSVKATSVTDHPFAR